MKRKKNRKTEQELVTGNMMAVQPQPNICDNQRKDFLWNLDTWSRT